MILPPNVTVGEFNNDEMSAIMHKVPDELLVKNALPSRTPSVLNVEKLTSVSDFSKPIVRYVMTHLDAAGLYMIDPEFVVHLVNDRNSDHRLRIVYDYLLKMEEIAVGRIGFVFVDDEDELGKWLESFVEKLFPKNTTRPPSARHLPDAFRTIVHQTIGPAATLQNAMAHH